MGLFKKNPLFCVLCVVFLLVFAGGTYLAIAESGKLEKSQKRVKGVEMQLQSVFRANPAPSSANVEVSGQNVEQLRAELQKIRENLQRGSRLTTSDDGVRVMSGVQQYISVYQNKVATTMVNGPGGVPVAISTPADFAFGFEAYIDKGVVPANKAAIPVLDKQRQILSYIADQLIASAPAGIQAIEREELEFLGAAEADKGKSKAGAVKKLSGFQINPAISARAPGAIDTLAFSVSFTGYTKSLRQFLNNLAEFDLPIVVRSVEVARPSGSATTTVKKSASKGLDDIFGVFGGASSNTANAETPQSEQKPVISENVSSFTVILEFIEIILPDVSETHS
jgi:hypothetical protein